jgi:hypothetical protein
VNRRLGRALGLAIAAAAVLIAAQAWARVGGGQSFGGGHSGGGGGGGDLGAIIAIFQLLFFLIELCIDHPLVGLPILGLLVVGVIYFAVAQQSSPAFEKTPPNRRSAAFYPRRAGSAGELG